MNRNCKNLPTYLQCYCNPASLILRLLAPVHVYDKESHESGSDSALLKTADFDHLRICYATLMSRFVCRSVGLSVASSATSPRSVRPKVGRLVCYFLVACYATLHPALSVRRSVTLYFFWVFEIFGFTAPAQMIW